MRRSLCSVDLLSFIFFFFTIYYQSKIYWAQTFTFLSSDASPGRKITTRIQQHDPNFSLTLSHTESEAAILDLLPFAPSSFSLWMKPVILWSPGEKKKIVCKLFILVSQFRVCLQSSAFCKSHQVRCTANYLIDREANTASWWSQGRMVHHLENGLLFLWPLKIIYWLSNPDFPQETFKEHITSWVVCDVKDDVLCKIIWSRLFINSLFNAVYEGENLHRKIFSL